MFPLPSSSALSNNRSLSTSSSVETRIRPVSSPSSPSKIDKPSPYRSIITPSKASPSARSRPLMSLPSFDLGDRGQRRSLSMTVVSSDVASGPASTCSCLCWRAASGCDGTTPTRGQAYPERSGQIKMALQKMKPTNKSWLGASAPSIHATLPSSPIPTGPQQNYYKQLDLSSSPSQPLPSNHPDRLPAPPRTPESHLSRRPHKPPLAKRFPSPPNSSSSLYPTKFSTLSSLMSPPAVSLPCNTETS